MQRDVDSEMAFSTALIDITELRDLAEQAISMSHLEVMCLEMIRY